MTSFSAYLSIYNDWDILLPSLKSIEGRISELVIVDGAYEWMAPYLRAIGKDPIRSDQALYDIVADIGIPTRIINQTWPNELAKRMAGYTACNTSHIFRIDADEVIFFDEEALDKALASHQAICEMEMPLYDSPGYVHARDETSLLGRQPLLFDARQVNAGQHLQYLWLVLTTDKLPEDLGDRVRIFEEPIAFNAHLSTWRSSEGHTQRAAFYWMNWMREHGCPWIPDLAGKPLDDIAKIMEFIPSDMIRSALSRSELANGHFKLIGSVLRPSPLSDEQEKIFSALYGRSLRSSFELNEAARDADQAFFAGANICFNISEQSGKRNFIDGSRFDLRTHDAVAGAKAQLHYVNSKPPFTAIDDLDIEIDGSDISIKLPATMKPSDLELRCVLTVSIWLRSGKGFGLFRLT